MDPHGLVHTESSYGIGMDEILQAVRELGERFNTKFDKLEAKFNNLEAKFDNLFVLVKENSQSLQREIANVAAGSPAMGARIDVHAGLLRGGSLQIARMIEFSETARPTDLRLPSGSPKSKSELRC